MQLFQRLFPKPQASKPHHLATIDFDGYGDIGKGQIVIATNRIRLALPSHHGDIALRDTTMTHGPYCEGPIVYRREFGWFVCDKCARFWQFPLGTTILGELIEYFDSIKICCVWKHSKKVVCDGPA